MNAQSKIPVYDLFIDPKDLALISKDIWREVPIRGKLKIKDQTHSVYVVYRGSHIRKFRKKSYRIIFPKVFLMTKEVHLNAEYMDKSMIRNKLSFDFFSDIGVLAPESRHALLKLNGQFQGVYLEIESVDRYFLKRRGLPEGDIFYAEDDDANFSLISPFDNKPKQYFSDGYSIKVGPYEAREHLSDLIFAVNTFPRESFGNDIRQYVDVDQYLRWLAGVVCTQNFDGFIHNYALYRRGDSGLFEVIPWDYDATWGRDINGRSMPHDYTLISGYNTLTARLLDDPAIRHKYRDILRGILEGPFTVPVIKPKVEAMHHLIRDDVLKDPCIGEDSDPFDREQAVILNYISKRTTYLRAHLSDLD